MARGIGNFRNDVTEVTSFLGFWAILRTQARSLGESVGWREETFLKEEPNQQAAVVQGFHL